MILITAMIAFLLVTIFFVIDVSKDQEVKSDASSYIYPFSAKTIVKHNFMTKPETVWKAITNLSEYNFWFPGILRLLPAIQNSSRYVQKYSFDKFHFAPGSEILVRPISILPTLKGKILSIDNNKSFKMEMQMSPLHKEMVFFDLKNTPDGTAVTCQRSSSGLFSWLSVIGFESKKSKILSNLANLLPIEIIESAKEKSKKDVASQQSSGTVSVAGVPNFADKKDMVAYIVNKVLDGDASLLSSLNDKVISGKSKAFLIKINKGSMDRPAMPDVGSATAAPAVASANASGEPTFASKDDHIAFLVNKVLDGDTAILDATPDKIIKAKAKSMIMKINKGSMDRPAMPEAGTTGAPAAAPATTAGPTFANKDEHVAYIVNKVLDGDNAILESLDDKVIRAKSKSMIMKINKGTAERPPMPEGGTTVAPATAPAESSKSESDEELITRLIADGVEGKMDEINALDNKILRGKIKSGIVKAKKNLK